MIRKNVIRSIALFMSISLFISGCSFNNKDKYPVDEDNSLEDKAMKNTEHYVLNENQSKSEIIRYVITDKKVLTLTFEGLGDKESLTNLLNKLDKHNIKATFFVSGIKIAEEPELAKMIIKAGHEIGNATLKGDDLTEVDYTEKIVQIKKSHDKIKESTGINVKYLRVGRNSIDQEVQMAASQGGYDKIISYNINPQDWDGKDSQEIADYIFKNKKRGGIVQLNLDRNPDVYQAIDLIIEKLNEKSFKIVSLNDLMDIYYERQKNKYILPEDWYKQYENKEENEYRIINNGSRNKKQIALTFDDWGTDDTIDSILDTLDEYNVKATFFLRAKGVENNPSLAYAISQRGHEIGSHTYNHTDLDTLTEKEIKEDIIKAHEVITNAINKEPKKYLRPPRGVMNEEVAKIVSQCGYKDIIMYGPSALDWKVENSAKYIENYMVNKVNNGDILLLHILDGLNTPQALPNILKRLQAKGYEFITIGEMIGDEN